MKTYLGIPTATTSDDALIAVLITAAQAKVDEYCHRTFEAAADSERTFDAVADVQDRALILDKDLASITSVTNGDSTTITSAQYVTDPPNAVADGIPISEIVIRSDASITWTYDDYYENAITIDGRWAYSTTVPADIAHACKRLTAFIYRQKDTNADIDRPLLTGDGVVIMPSTMPGDVASILKPYRRRL